MNRKAPPVRVVFSFEERKNVTGFFEVLIRVERRSKKEGKKKAKKGRTSYSNLGDVGSLLREPILFFTYLIYHDLMYFLN